MSTEKRQQDGSIPTWVLACAGVLVGFVVILTTFAMPTDRVLSASPPVTTADVLTSRDLIFLDDPKGGFVAFDVNENREIRHVLPGEGGFIRGVLRSLVRERRQNGIGKLEPFRLTAFADGRIQIQDLSTGRIIDLGAFGPTNAEAFASLLSAKGERS
jgi:putative photosynthetic complex assembly protein